MDKYFSNILNTLSKLEEPKSTKLVEGKQLTTTFKSTLSAVEEGSMNDAAKHEQGPKFTGYWKGKDKRTPSKKMVGASESVEQRLKQKWDQFIAEVGMGGAAAPNAIRPTQQPASAADQVKAVQQVNNVSQSINKAKSAGILPSNTSTQQSAETVVDDPQDITKASPQQKKEITQAGQSFNDFVKAASNTTQGQAALNSVLAHMKKVKQTPGM